MSEFIVGLTGGVASGKTAATRCFEALGVFVADADVAAREAVALGSEGLDEVVAVFGADVLDASGALDRAAMRRIVFADEAARKRLEAIVHPRVRKALRAACEAAPSTYAIAAIPLLAEGGGRGAYPWLDRILVIDVPRETQIERLMRRDGVDAALAEKMLAAQSNREQRLAIADDVVVNAGSLQALEARIAELHARYLALAAVS
ncbi:dephospho-CoA kinase [Luteimonas gilva]|uniref:Dephospho-CoA kinase n=1 Tax=Luteimonas gilva TaxID=2572684 RepID=A0A4U5JJN8_9GAMM|nr:dephospho-CoA kinase [Luteimonas gilva]TKR29800.1 dephospho-CoA kinase [Luteimonas gilva]